MTDKTRVAQGGTSSKAGEDGAAEGEDGETCAECVRCGKWRELPGVDADDVPHDFECSMNPDPAYASCDIPEQAWEE